MYLKAGAYRIFLHEGLSEPSEALQKRSPKPTNVFFLARIRFSEMVHHSTPQMPTSTAQQEALNPETLTPKHREPYHGSQARRIRTPRVRLRKRRRFGKAEPFVELKVRSFRVSGLGVSIRMEDLDIPRQRHFSRFFGLFKGDREASGRAEEF